MPETVLGAGGGAAEVIATGTIDQWDGTFQAISTGITDPTRRVFSVVVPNEDPVPAGSQLGIFHGDMWGGWIDSAITNNVGWDDNAGEWIIQAEGTLTNATDVRWAVIEF